MYAHHVIEDLESTLRARAIPSPMYRESIKFVIKNIKNAQQFFLGEFQDFRIALETTLTENTALFLNECSPFTRLPYKICWFEFTNTFKDVSQEENVPKRGVLAIEIKPDLIWVWIVNYMNSMAMWAVSPQSYYISIGKTLSEDTVFLAMVQQMNPALLQDKKAMENIHKSNIFPMPLSDVIDSKTSHELGKDDQRDIYVLNSALVLLNCKNVESEDILPPDKVNKKRRKNGKQELFTYKILQLKLPSVRNSTPDIEKTTVEEAKRIHLCRGHFKIFTDENPLFGKHTGVYWWQPHLRGDKKVGLVEKDYLIKTYK